METSTRVNPYIGSRPFETEEQKWFFGREKEVDELLDYLIADRIVLLHAPSGTGKSSLLNAGLLPRLINDFHIFPVVRPSYGAINWNSQDTNPLLLSTLMCLASTNKAKVDSVERLAKLANTRYGLEDYIQEKLNKSKNAVSYEGNTERGSNYSVATNALIIFDQFEEIFHNDPNESMLTDFFCELGQALQNPQMSAIFAIRDDYLGHLTSFVDYIPTYFDSKLDLRPMDAATALVAIQKPALTQNVEILEDSANFIIENLTKTSGGSRNKIVEPVYLQVICWDFWSELTKQGIIDEEVEHKVTITEGEAHNIGFDFDEPLARYYAQSILEATQLATDTVQRVTTERNIREWIERFLIDRKGTYRPQTHLGTSDQEPKEEMLSHLVNKHLLRRYEQYGSVWYHLAHDRLIEPILKQNAAWRIEHLQPFQRRAFRWNQLGAGVDRSDLLLDKKELKKAQIWIETNQYELQEYEQQFLNLSTIKVRDEEQEEQREKERLAQEIKTQQLTQFNKQLAEKNQELQQQKLQLLSLTQELRVKKEEAEEKAEEIREINTVLRKERIRIAGKNKRLKFLVTSLIMSIAGMFVFIYLWYTVDSTAKQEQASSSVTMLLEKKDYGLASQFALKSNLQSAQLYNSICQQGSLGGFTDDVMESCDKAVEIAKNSEIGNCLDSRGIARVLTNDFAGAIEDFNAFVEWAAQDNRRPPETINQRKQWIELLQKNKNPLTEQVLEGLKEKNKSIK